MTGAEALIRREIHDSGPMRFARFMELALYAPGVGYYERSDRALGRGGDFYTSVTVGPMFGFLLAWRAADWLAEWERLDILESGAHDGRLAADILAALDAFHPGAAARTRYHLVEPSDVRRARQRATLGAHSSRVTWHESLASPSLPVAGFLVANELLDAFPVHRYVWEAGTRRWRECGVGLTAEGLNACRLDPGSSFESPGEAAWEGVLEEGWVCEQSPAAAAWWIEAARRLRRGWLVTFDYGHDHRFGLRPDRPQGSLRAYRNHRVSEDLLKDPGEQDLTAHVDFDAVRRAGEAQGWTTRHDEPQGRCLGRWAAEVLRLGGGGAEWIQAHARQLQTLTHPAHLGHSFRALVQSKGVPWAGESTQ